MPATTKKSISSKWNADSTTVPPRSNDSVKVLNQGLRSLYEATEELQFSKPLGILLKAILRGLKNGTNIQRAAVFVYDEGSETLAGTSGIGITETKLSSIRIPLQSEDEDQLLQLKFSSQTPDPAQTARDRICSALMGAAGWHGVELIPLEIRDRLVGVLAFDPNVEPTPLPEIVVLFARQAAYIIENARLFTQVESMALRDPLTGLYNRRYLLQILEYELNRARRYRQPLCVVFLDLDHFKAVNDTCGHAMGDRLLKQIATRLGSLFRTTDVVGRYAGDEFLAILPNTPRAGAHVLADRLLHALRDYEMMVRGRTLKVSVSIGLDCYEGEDGVGSATLIDRADKAMYDAKSAGRSRVCAYKNEQPVPALA
jgi:two-component system, cell cycle response regulator